MINLPKNLIKAVADGAEPQTALETYIINNNNIGDIVKSFAELLVNYDTYTRQPIVVTQEEYHAITSLFKVRGQRTMEDGSVITETRGRKKK